MRRIEWVSGKEYAARIEKFLKEVDEILCPQLSKRVDMKEYAQKLAENADSIFIVDDGRDIASCSVYCNTEQAFISSIAVCEEFQHQHIGQEMMLEVKHHVQEKGCKNIKLDVYADNTTAIAYYGKNGFEVCGQREDWLIMKC